MATRFIGLKKVLACESGGSECEVWCVCVCGVSECRVWMVEGGEGSDGGE